MRFGLKIACLGLLATAILGVQPSGSATAETSPASIDTALSGTFKATAKIVRPPRALQCVPFARRLAGIRIRGDAWTWWGSAKGRYDRGQRPSVGAVLVMKKTKRLRRGHLAVVRQIVDDRTIVVDQANWLNRGRIHLNTAVRDVSAKNDWSAVRVWYTPGARLGSGTYAVRGFIYPGSPRLLRAGVQPVPMPRRRPSLNTLAMVDGLLGVGPLSAPLAARRFEGPGETKQAGHKTQAKTATPAHQRVGYDNPARDDV